MANRQRWWWIRHAPSLTEPGTYIGRRDVDMDLPDASPLEWLATQLPSDAAWLTSPLKRCRQTAARLQESQGHAPATALIDAFREQDFGDWEGKTYQHVWEAEKALHDWSDPASILPRNGESYHQVFARTTAGIEAALSAVEAEEIIAVGHAGTIRAAVAHALQMSPAQALHLHVDYLSLTCLDYYREPQGWVVRLMNWAPLVSR